MGFNLTLIRRLDCLLFSEGWVAPHLPVFSRFSPTILVRFHSARVDDAVFSAAENPVPFQLGDVCGDVVDALPEQLRQASRIEGSAVDAQLPVWLSLVHDGEHIDPRTASGSGA
tara:strand:+ start:1966 stop:2307 length:342 start_codon:yes stop_codon:yes gene_type:complete